MHKKPFPKSFFTIILLLILGVVSIVGVYFGVNKSQSLLSQASLSSTFSFEPVYRLYKESAGDHFYVIGTEDVKNAIVNSGYSFEGIEFWAVKSPANNPSLVPVYKLYNPTSLDHFYTTKEAEKSAALTAQGYVDEGIAFYTFTESSAWSGLLPVYQLFNGRDHFYSSNKGDADFALTIGYQNQGIAFYAPPLPRLANTQAVYTLNSHDQLLTPYKSTEITDTIRKYNYSLGGLAFFAYSNTAASTSLKPVYRLAKSDRSGRFYTVSESEKTEKLSQGYQNEGSYFFAEPTKVGDSIPVYRLVSNAGNYQYTTSYVAKDTMLAQGTYRYDGIAFYVPKASPDYINPQPVSLTFAPMISSNCRMITAKPPKWFEKRDGNCGTSDRPGPWIISSTVENDAFTGGTVSDWDKIRGWGYTFSRKPDNSGNYEVNLSLDKIKVDQRVGKNNYTAFGFNDWYLKEPVTLDKNIYFRVDLKIAEMVTTKPSDKNRVSLGFVIEDKTNRRYYMEFNVLQTANFDLCTDVNLGGKGVSLPCDSEGIIDRRSADDEYKFDIVYYSLAGLSKNSRFSDLFSPFSIAPNNQYKVIYIPVSKVFARTNWAKNQSLEDLTMLGAYIGTEVYGEGKTSFTISNYDLYRFN